MSKFVLGKLTKLLLLILISGAVVSASAAVYNMMYLQSGPVAVEGAKVTFVSGTDSTLAGATIGTNATYVRFTGLKGWPNATRVYEDSVGIKNDDTSSRTIKVTYSSWSGDTSAVDSMLLKVYNGAGSQQGTTVTIGTTDSSTGDISIGSSSTYRVQWEIRWKATALSSNTVDVILTMKVNE